jgi:hypothetical protein
MVPRAMEGLPRFGQPLPEAKPHWDFLPAIDWFWVRVAVKGGLAAVISIVSLKWINPPGPASIPLMAWLLTILGRPSLRVGGTGDLRGFQTAFRASLMLAACAALLILTTPFLADYAVMNGALFLILFTLGFLGMFIGTVLSRLLWPVCHKESCEIISLRFLPRSKRCSREIPIERRFRRNWRFYHWRLDRLLVRFE